MDDTLMIFYDDRPPDVPTLCVAKEADKGFWVLNKIQGNEAFGIYHYLTNGAELKSAREISKKPELIDGRFKCPSCHSNDRALNYYCDICGQKIDWDFE